MSQDASESITLPEPKEKRLALIIGVDQAAHADDPLLQNTLNASKDALDIANVLEDPHCGFTLLQPPLMNEQANSAAVKRAILDLARHNEPDNFLLLYFAGHGYSMRVSGGVSDIFLVTHDFIEREVEQDETLHLSMRWLRDKLYHATDRDGRAAGKILLIFDCCKGGNFGRTGEDPYLQELQQRLRTYFDAPAADVGLPPGVSRLALAATGHGQLAGEQDGHGKMTLSLLKALRGEVDSTINLQDYGRVNLSLVENYLHDEMQGTGQTPTLSGDNAGQRYVLAQYEARAQEIRRRNHFIVHERPSTYIPLGQPEDFQIRSNELDEVTAALLEGSGDRSTRTQGPVVGLLGMGGIGKSYLALTLAYRHKGDNSFPGGIFWLPVTKKPGAPIQAKLDQADMQWLLASLCENADYRPPDDDVTHPDNEKRRASHICRYLAQHPDALLILDNVDDIHLLLKENYLPSFAGEGLRCTILYTSRSLTPPSYVRPYRVEKLTEEGAFTLLLAHRPEELQHIRADLQGPLAEDARAICIYVDRLPLALTLLRDLLQDDQLTLAHLREALVKRGVFEITSDGEDVLTARLFETFKHSWERVRTAQARRLFQLAASFPEAIQIPLWLLGGVSELSGQQALEPLGQARQELRRWSLIEVSPDGESIRMHPLIREFGQQLNRTDRQYSSLRVQAQKWLMTEFTTIDNLERRARASGYWTCLDDVTVALTYARSLKLDTDQVTLLERIAYWLARDSDVLGTAGLWPQELPALFYQQVYNRTFEEGYYLEGNVPATPWIRQQRHVGARAKELEGRLKHPNEVTSVAFSLVDKRMLTACADGVTRTWDMQRSRPLHHFAKHDDAVTRAVFSPDGRLVATCSLDTTARIYESTSGKLLHTLRRHSSPIQSIAFSPDGSYVATASEDETACVWSVASGTMEFYLAGHRAPVLDGAFSPDGTLLVTCATNGSVYLWDIEHEQVRETLLEESDAMKSVAFSPRGNYILISCIEGVLLWDVHAKKICKRFAVDYSEKGYFITQVAFSPNERYIAVSSSENMAQVWEIQTGLLWGTFRHDDLVSGVAFSPDETMIATASFDRTASFWTLPSQPAGESSEQEHFGKIGSMCFSGNGEWLVATTDERWLQMWDVRRELQEVHVQLPINERYKITASVAISRDGTLVSIGFFNTVLLWNREKKYIQPFGVDVVSDKSQLTLAGGIALSPDGGFIASGTTDETARVWDRQNRRVVGHLQGHRGDITVLAYAPDGKSIVTGSTDGTARIWRTQDFTSRATLPGHVGEVTTLCISPDGALIATGALDGSVRLWSMEHGALIGNVKRNVQRITCLAFSPDGRFLVSCDLLGQVLFWSVRPHEQPSALSLVGWYVAPQKIGAVHWGEPRHVMLVDTGDSESRPHFYHLALEGDWGFDMARS